MSAAETVTPIREAHKALTRERIVEAALELVQGEEAESLTLAGVARAAGVTERTLYRHFATRDELLAAVWTRINEKVALTRVADSPAALIAQPLHMFRQFDVQEPLIRAIVTSRQGRELRLRVNADRQKAIRKVVRAARPDLREPALTRLSAVVQLLDSSIAWSAMKDYWGLDGDAAGRAASEAIALLLAAPRPRAYETEQER